MKSKNNNQISSSYYEKTDFSETMKTSKKKKILAVAKIIAESQTTYKAVNKSL